jgi:uncharacterized protein
MNPCWNKFKKEEEKGKLHFDYSNHSCQLTKRAPDLWDSGRFMRFQMIDKKIEKNIEDAFEESKVLVEKQKRFSQPFRNRFDHTKRVLRWAERIHAIEGGDIGIITLAVIFHDTGWSENEDHAVIGAQLAEKYLVRKGVASEIVNRIVSAVKTHNKRQMPGEDLPIENLIVMDADLLDELGVTTLVWDAMATANQENPSYSRALERNQKYFEGSKEKTNFLQTKTGVKLYRERIAMWEKCLDHFRYELGLSDDFAT